jgi:hypothetical protein
MKKIPFLMLELMIALCLVATCALPLVQFPKRVIQEEFHSAYRLQAQRLADLAFAQIKEKLYREKISWKEICSPKGEGSTVLEETLKAPFGRLGTRTFLCKGTLHSVGKTGKGQEEFRLATLRVTITPEQRGLKLFRTKKNRVASKTYTYQMLLSKPPSNNISIKDSR